MIVDQTDRQHSWDYADRDPLPVSMRYAQFGAQIGASAQRDTYTPPAGRLAKLVNWQVFIQRQTVATALGAINADLYCDVGGAAATYFSQIYGHLPNTAGQIIQMSLPGGWIVTENDDWYIYAGESDTDGTINWYLNANFIEFDA